MWLRNLPKSALKSLIRVYAYAISPLMGGKCRFYPTCSTYAINAIDHHGVAKGGVMALKRLLKCHPWYKGEMLDPVPASIDWTGVIGYKRTAHQTGCDCNNDKKDKTHAEP